ncbi:hypothetical protein C7293_09855 [filamentous cyanobacterium CCT1]|nr:hypothetical protein C7293_09855 [filamentous cyanobacterium CCT1]PSN81283.1 hypothetical protein C8B47_02175 [filamentous cyanobacterium CCP4]
MLPLIVVEDLISAFKFWNKGIHEGMLYRNDFYISRYQFALSDRSEAYRRATEESNKGFKVCVTVSKTHYRVWVEMRSHLA